MNCSFWYNDKEDIVKLKFNTGQEIEFASLLAFSVFVQRAYTMAPHVLPGPILLTWGKGEDTIQFLTREAYLSFLKSASFFLSGILEEAAPGGRLLVEDADMPAPFKDAINEMRAKDTSENESP